MDTNLNVGKNLNKIFSWDYFQDFSEKREKLLGKNRKIGKKSEVEKNGDLKKIPLFEVNFFYKVFDRIILGGCEKDPAVF